MKHGEWLGAEDKYLANKNTNNPYGAFHTNYIKKGLGVEAQFRTKKYGALNDKMHQLYKSSKHLTKYEKQVRKLFSMGY
jgi:hypothetical protein